MDDKLLDIKSLNEKIEKESAFVDLLQIELEIGRASCRERV